MIGAVLVLVSIVVLPRLAPEKDRRFLTTVLAFALITKIAATLFRMFMNEVVYRGGDLNGFDGTGAVVAAQVRSGDFSTAIEGFAIGTSAMGILTGLVYSVTGTSFFGVFLLSGFLGFLGAILFYRAFQIAFPNGSSRLFGALILFYPAVLYWPTGFGKDVIVFLMLGLTTWGAAQFIIRSRISGLWVAIVSLVFMFLIRPEIGLIASIAFITAFVLRTPSRNKRAFSIQLVGVPAILMIGFIVLSRATSFLGIEDLSLSTVLDVMTEQSSRVFDEGRSGSNFVPPEVGTVTWIPEAFITVLFRPFPWEVDNVPALIQAFDGALLAGILILSSARFVRAIRSEGQNPITIFSIVFMLMSVIALATLGNFGLLARQRVIVLPFIFMMISAVKSEARRRRSRAGVEQQAQEASAGQLVAGNAG